MSLFLRETEINSSGTSSRIGIEVEPAGSILSDFRANPAGTSSLVS
jgi:hypothetical protein